MFVKPGLKCEGCIKPIARRMALFESKDEYECYAERYVKCFWGLCDLHKSEHSIIPTSVKQIVTEQPKPAGLPILNPIVVHN